MRSTRKDKILSVVDIGLAGKANVTHNFKFNIAQKLEPKLPKAGGVSPQR